LKWCVDRLAPEGAARHESRIVKLANVTQPVPQGNFPNRIHVIEDYETDIERRWWLCGKVETKDVAAGGGRACRAVLTNDFDDRMGDQNKMYKAVIFNPVPGPPMGKNTRLSFRYRLQGADSLRVQIYSLTNGYHRHLTLTGLKQGSLEAAAVDMTQARRPDGSGGKLSENDRIDDIQFYTDPAAELLIDDIVLYDLASEGETRPFPRRPIFTGWFDTGRQAKEWPGSFEIVAKKQPFTWRAAKSVASQQLGQHWIRLHLRGERPLGDATHLFLRYHLTGADQFRVLLSNRGNQYPYFIDLKAAKKDDWTSANLDFSLDALPGDKSARKPRKGDRVDEIHFQLASGGELLVDDVLLYEPK